MSGYDGPGQGFGFEHGSYEEVQMNFRRFLPSPSMGVALLALAIALGGTAYAANKIGSNQIKKNAVTTAKIKGKAVKTGKIAGKAVTSGKLAKDAAKSGKIADEAVTTGKLGDGSVTTGKIADDAVNSSKISDYGTIGNGTAIQATDGPSTVSGSGRGTCDDALSEGSVYDLRQVLQRHGHRQPTWGDVRQHDGRTSRSWKAPTTRSGGAVGDRLPEYRYAGSRPAARYPERHRVSNTNYDEEESMMAAPGRSGDLDGDRHRSQERTGTRQRPLRTRQRLRIPGRRLRLIWPLRSPGSPAVSPAERSISSMR